MIISILVCFLVFSHHATYLIAIDQLLFECPPTSVPPKNGTSLTLNIATSVVFDATCVFSSNNTNITVVCLESTGDDHHPVELKCPTTSPCFQVAGSMSSISVIGCVIRGTALHYEGGVYPGSVTIDKCVLDGRGMTIPVIIQKASFFVMTRTWVTRGVNNKVDLAGGCLTLLGVRASIVISNVTMTECVSVRGGGCVFISGCPVVPFSMAKQDEQCFEFGGNVTVTSTVMETCTTKVSSGGSFRVEAMRALSLINNVVQHGIAHGSSGCIDIYDLTGPVVIHDLRIHNCTSQNGRSGCISISSIAERSPTTFDVLDSSVVQVSNLHASDCVGKNDTGCLSILFTPTSDVENVTLQNCRAVKGGAFTTINSTVRFTNLTIANAQANVTGGAIMATTSNVTLRRCIMTNAVAPDGACIKLFDSNFSLQDQYSMQCVNTNAIPPTSKRYTMRRMQQQRVLGRNDTDAALDAMTTTVTLMVESNTRNGKHRSIGMTTTDVTVLRTSYGMTSTSWVAPPDLIASTQVVQSVYTSSCRGRSGGTGRNSLKHHALSLVQFMSESAASSASIGMDVVVTLGGIALVHLLCCGGAVLSTMTMKPNAEVEAHKPAKVTQRVKTLLRFMPYAYRYHLSFLIPMMSSLASYTSSPDSASTSAGVVSATWIGFLTLTTTPITIHYLLYRKFPKHQQQQQGVTPQSASPPPITTTVFFKRTEYRQTRSVSSLVSLQQAGVGTLKSLGHTFLVWTNKHGEWSPLSVTMLGGPFFTTYRGDFRGVHVWLWLTMSIGFTTTAVAAWGSVLCNAVDAGCGIAFIAMGCIHLVYFPMGVKVFNVVRGVRLVTCGLAIVCIVAVEDVTSVVPGVMVMIASTAAVVELSVMGLVKVYILLRDTLRKNQHLLFGFDPHCCHHENGTKKKSEGGGGTSAFTDVVVDD
eukprot:PhF_6_TR12279/c0_g1_i1/m.19479